MGTRQRGPFSRCHKVPFLLAISNHVLCWNAGDLERKLADFQASYNAARSHASWEGYTPLGFAGERTAARAEFNHVRWISHCRGMVQLPAAA